MLTLIQFAFVKHPRINDLHQSLNNVSSDAVDAEQDIGTSFTNASHTDVKNAADLTKAACRLLVEKIISPHSLYSLFSLSLHSLLSLTRGTK